MNRIQLTENNLNTTELVFTLIDNNGDAISIREEGDVLGYEEISIMVKSIKYINNIGSTGSNIYTQNGSVFSVLSDVNQITDILCDKDINYIVIDENREKIDTSYDEFKFEDCDYNLIINE